MNLHQMAADSRKAFYEIAVSKESVRNRVLLSLIDILSEKSDDIYAANQLDLAEAKSNHLAAPLLHRLLFGPEKLSQVTDGLRSLIALEDPIGRTTLATEITEDLRLFRVTCPIGVIGVIFESRPDALVQIASLCIKSGNAVLLKGGHEAYRTNLVLTGCIQRALQPYLPPETVQLLESREDVSAMLKEDHLIDLIIPRGSNAFVRYIIENSNIPVLGHADGICHVYIDESADPQTALRVALDSKIQNVSVCNAMETLLIHEKAAPSLLPLLYQHFTEAGVEVRGDSRAALYCPCVPATEDDWSSEYLDYILSVRVVSSLKDAIDHINFYGSHHTDCIVTNNSDHAEEFMNKVDSAGTYWNVSTRFADGFVYGLGAEVGISTGKIHARGPMGLEGLTTYKYKLFGNGHTMAEMKDGTRSYTHTPLKESCPF